MSAKYIETSSRTGHNVGKSGKRSVLKMLKYNISDNNLISFSLPSEELFRMIAEDFIKSQKKISPSTDGEHTKIDCYCY